MLLIEKMSFLQEFFLNVKCRIRCLGAATKLQTFSKWTDDELELNKKFYSAKEAVHNALCGTQSITPPNTDTVISVNSLDPTFDLGWLYFIVITVSH